MELLNIFFGGGSGGGGGVRLQSYCKVELHSVQINFTAAQLPLLILGGGGQTVVTAKLELHSLQPNFHFSDLGGAQTALVTGKVELALTETFPMCIASGFPLVELKYLMHSLAY